MIAIGPDEVHVWIVETTGLIAHDVRGEVAAEDQQEAAEFALDARRDEFVRQRGALRRLLGGYVDQPPHTLKFVRGATGKPALADATAGIEFNLSHSGAHMLVAVARNRRVGVDVQVIRPDTQCLALARRFFAPAEVDYLKSRPAADVPRAFFDLWTLKEAWLKATGGGIAAGLNQFRVDASVDPPLLHITDDAAAHSGQLRRIHELAPTPAAVAVEAATPISLRVRRWGVADCSPPDVM